VSKNLDGKLRGEENLNHQSGIKCVHDISKKKHNLEMKGSLNSGNACYYSVRNLLSSQLLSRSIKVKIFRVLISPIALYVCETWPLRIRQGLRIIPFDIIALKKIFRHKTKEAPGGWIRMFTEEPHNL
jgi:hypothetical protein